MGEYIDKVVEKPVQMQGEVFDKVVEVPMEKRVQEPMITKVRKAAKESQVDAVDRSVHSPARRQHHDVPPVNIVDKVVGLPVLASPPFVRIEDIDEASVEDMPATLFPPILLQY